MNKQTDSHRNDHRYHHGYRRAATFFLATVVAVISLTSSTAMAQDGEAQGSLPFTAELLGRVGSLFASEGKGSLPIEADPLGVLASYSEGKGSLPKTAIELGFWLWDAGHPGWAVELWTGAVSLEALGIEP